MSSLSLGLQIFPHRLPNQFANRLCTVQEVLRRTVFKVVDLKVKVVQKHEGKQLVYKNGLIHR